MIMLVTSICLKYQFLFTCKEKALFEPFTHKKKVTMAQGSINLSLFGLKVARGTPNRVFAFFLIIFFSTQKMFRSEFYCKI